MMYTEPHAWATLLNWCADVSGAFLQAQVLAGASAAQLFDSWVGSLSEQQYVRRVAPHSKRALSHLRGLEIPKVHFGVGSNEVLVAMRDIGADVMGVDWRIPLDEANRRLGGTVPLQGNLDPALLGAPEHILQAHVADVIDRGREAPAHVLNLGHGVPPTTDPDVLTRIVEQVHAG
jgi:uroporphyrinogen decarboxylase